MIWICYSHALERRCLPRSTVTVNLLFPFRFLVSSVCLPSRNKNKVRSLSFRLSELKTDLILRIGCRGCPNKFPKNHCLMHQTSRMNVVPWSCTLPQLPLSAPRMIFKLALYFLPFFFPPSCRNKRTLLSFPVGSILPDKNVVWGRRRRWWWTCRFPQCSKSTVRST